MSIAATLFSALTNKFFENVEWLVENQVNIINYSAGVQFKDQNGNILYEKDLEYNDYSGWVDHIVYQHNVSLVNATGNTSKTPYTSTPANAFNVIAVGGIDDKCTISVSDDRFWNGSCYITGSGMPSKPDVVAPACGFNLSGGYGGDGTSFAAPLVTGMIAQMMSFCPTLKFRPEAAKPPRN